MGAAQAKEPGALPPPPEDYYKKILQAFDATYNEHNPEILRTILKNTFPSFTSDKVVDHVVKQHSELLHALGRSSGTISDNKLEEAFTQLGVSSTQMKDYESAFPQIKDKVIQLKNLIQGLHTKYQYFEYKYIEMNLFVMILVDNILRMFDSHSQIVETEIVALQQTFLTEVNKFTDALSSIKDTNNSKDAKDYATLVNELKTKTAAHMGTFEQNLKRSEKYKDDLTAMITSLVEKDPAFAQQISEAVNKTKPVRGGRSKRTEAATK